MLNLKIIAAGKLKELFYIDACIEYFKRLRTMAEVSVTEIAEESGRPDGLEREGDKILSAIPKQAYVIAMCIEGTMLSSEELARRFERAQVSGVSHIVFIIGSSEGLADKVKQRADFRLSMSKMTFPHHLARVMVLEQIYRALSINAGSKYHK